MNIRNNNTSGYNGVRWTGHSWKYQIDRDERRYTRSGFSTAQAAHEARQYLLSLIEQNRAHV